MRKRMFIGVAAVATVLALVAASGAAAGRSAMTTVKLAVYPSLDYAPLYVGLKRNVFAKHGLKLDIKYVYTGTGLMSAVTSGQVDIATNSVTAGVNAIIQGLPIRMLTATDYEPTKGNTEVLVKADSPIKTFADLAGKTVATINLQGLFELGVIGAIDKAGGDGTSIKALPMSPLDEPNALRAGRVDAIVLQDPFLSEALAQGGLRSIGNPYASLPYKVAAGAFFSSTSTIASKPALLKSFLAAWHDAVQIALKNPKLTRRIIPKYTGIKGKILSMITPPIYASSMPARDLGAMMRNMISYKWIPSNPPGYDKLVWTGK